MQYVPHFTTFTVGNHFPTPPSFDRKYSNLFYKMWWVSFFFLWLWVFDKNNLHTKDKNISWDMWFEIVYGYREFFVIYLRACTYKLVLVLRCQRIKHNHKIPVKIFWVVAFPQSRCWKSLTNFISSFLFLSHFFHRLGRQNV